MADGTFAVLMLILGMVDMNANHCGTDAGCLGRSETTPRLSFSAGQVLARQASTASEVYLRYDLSHKMGPFGNAVGLSVGENGETWLGFGQTYDVPLGNSAWFAQFHAMPGLYFDNGGFDLGGIVEFRSGLEIGYEANNGWRYGLSYDHRSNAGIYKNNPGIETIQFRVNVPLGRS